MQCQNFVKILRANKIKYHKGIFKVPSEFVSKFFVHDLYSEGSIKWYKFHEHPKRSYFDIKPMPEFLKLFSLEKGMAFVYVAYDSTGLCKIGKAKNIEKRVLQMKTGNSSISLLRVYNGGYTLESELHDKFKSQRISGEWFKLGKEDIKWMDENLSRVPNKHLPQKHLWKPPLFDAQSDTIRLGVTLNTTVHPTSTT